MTLEDTPGRRLSRRRLLQTGLVGAGVLAVGGAGRQLYLSPSSFSKLRPPIFGMLQADPAMYDDLRAAGVRMVTLSLVWSSAEPDGPGLDAAYLRDVADQHRRAQAAGLEVALSAGLQYPPPWVLDLPDAHFLDQQGRRPGGGLGANTVDAVFNAQVRATQQAYLERLSHTLGGLGPAAIRVGGLDHGELHYPPRVDEQRNTFWAFGHAARTRSPVPSFRPGQGTAAEAAVFLDWYLDSLAEYGRWQLDTYRQYFGPDPRLIMLLPSWGVRPGDIEAAVAMGLSGTTRGERRDTLTQGVDWARQLPLFAEVDGVAACTTWLDPPDQGSGAAFSSPGVYLATLTRRHGLPLWGENTGDNDEADMRRCIERVHSLDLEGLFWMSGRELGEQGNATLDDYARLIAAGG